MGSMLLEIFPVSPHGNTGKISNNIEPIRGNLNEHIYICIYIYIIKVLSVHCSKSPFGAFRRWFEVKGAKSSGVVPAKYNINIYSSTSNVLRSVDRISLRSASYQH